MELAEGVAVDDDSLRSFCAEHGIRSLRLFGSALHGTLRPDSDIDLLVEFEPDRTPGLLSIAQLELELGEMLGRQVDLRTLHDLSRHSATRSPPRPALCMTPPDDLVRLRHLREAAEKAIAFSSGRSRGSLDDDELLRLGLTKLIEIVGEAAKQVSEPTQAQHPAVPWSAVARMRDRLIHHYFNIDLDVLWATVTQDLPELLEALPTADELER